MPEGLTTGCGSSSMAQKNDLRDLYYDLRDLLLPFLLRERSFLREIEIPRLVSGRPRSRVVQHFLRPTIGDLFMNPRDHIFFGLLDGP